MKKASISSCRGHHTLSKTFQLSSFEKEQFTCGFLKERTFNKVEFSHQASQTFLNVASFNMSQLLMLSMFIYILYVEEWNM